jgi:hypothetical protein
MTDTSAVTVARQTISSLQRQRVNLFTQIADLRRRIEAIDASINKAKRIVQRFDQEKDTAA